MDQSSISEYEHESGVCDEFWVPGGKTAAPRTGLPLGWCYCAGELEIIGARGRTARAYAHRMVLDLF